MFVVHDKNGVAVARYDSESELMTYMEASFGKEGDDYSLEQDGDKWMIATVADDAAGYITGPLGE